MIKPVHDLVMVELEESNPYGYDGSEDKPTERGILRQLPDKAAYLGFNSFAFEDSLGNGEFLVELWDTWRGSIGHMVYWSEYSERGSVVEYEGKRYAFIKLTSLIAEDDDTEAKGKLVGKTGGKAFGV